jgi:hypothetical protein
MGEQMTVPAEQRPCQAHRDHGSASPLRTVGHHILPKEWGGDPKGELYWCCDNFHYSVHRIMDWLRHTYEHMVILTPRDVDGLLKERPPFMPPHGLKRELSLARLGFRRWLEAGRPK